MAPIFSRATIRTSTAERRWLAVSFAVAVILLIWTRTAAGDFTGGYSDHVHHARATWAFLTHGLDAYRRPLIETGVGSGYLQAGMTWETYPVAYPPGMFVAFLLPALGGSVYAGPEANFGKLIILELLVISHASLWAIAHVFRRVGSMFWVGVLVLIWTFLVRITLFGFYDGLWLLAGAIGIDQLLRKKPGPALGYFVVAGMCSYRAAAFSVLAAMALIDLLRSDARRLPKIAYVSGAVVCGAIVVWSFAMLVKYSPHDGAAGSPLLPMKFVGYSLLLFGLGVSALLAARVSIPIGLSVLLSSGLSIVHAGHHWHACVCIPPLLALPLATRQPLWAQVLLACWLLVFMRYAFLYDPFVLLDELLRFIERNGRPGH